MQPDDTIELTKMAVALRKTLADGSNTDGTKDRAKAEFFNRCLDVFSSSSPQNAVKTVEPEKAELPPNVKEITEH